MEDEQRPNGIDASGGARLVGRDDAERAVRDGRAVDRYHRAGPSASPLPSSVPQAQGIPATEVHDDAELMERPGGAYAPSNGAREHAPQVIDLRAAESAPRPLEPQVMRIAAEVPAERSASEPEWLRRPTENASAQGPDEHLDQLAAASGLGSRSSTGRGDAPSVDPLRPADPYSEPGETTASPPWSVRPAATPSATSADIGGAVPTGGASTQSGEASVSSPPAAPDEPSDGSAAVPPIGLAVDPTIGSRRAGTRFRATQPAGARARAVVQTVSFARRTITAVVFAGLAVAAFSAGPTWTFAFALAVVLLAAVEYFDGVRRAGHRPATLLGLLAVAGLMSGAWARGPAALPLLVVLTTFFTFLWFLAGISRKGSPTTDVAVTVLGVLWTGMLGAYAALLLRQPDRTGMAFFIGAVVVTAIYDTAAYVGGSVFGKRPLAPAVSPGKTWEGAAVGTVAALATGVVLLPMIHPWTLTAGAMFGLVVATVAPLGDLAESLVKRDLGLKDMGRLLPGHGGVFDRFDALLFVLPATYYLVEAMNLTS